jgi:parvulin-like peptidyl-prolyl isomerase
MKKIFFVVVQVICIGLVCNAFSASGGGGDGQAPEAVKQAQPDSHVSEATAKAKEGGENTIVARVNGVDIDLQSLLNMMNSERARFGRATLKPEQMKALREAALDRLIFDELAYQSAKASGIKADPTDIDHRIEELKVQYGGPEAFKETLKKAGVTEEDLRKQIARDMVLQRIYKREIDDKVGEAPEDRLKKEYEKEKGNFLVAEKGLVNDIIFFLDIDKEESLQKAGKILQELRADKNRDPKSLPLDGTFIVRELELSKLNEPQLYDEAKKLKVGEYSDIIKTKDSLQIIQLKEYEPARQYTFEEMRGFLADRFKKQAELKRAQEWERELKKNAKIEILDTGENEQSPAGSGK